VLLPKFFPPYDRVICLDAATGRELWKSERFPGIVQLGYGGACWCASATPAIVGNRCYVQGSAGLYCLSMKDGALVWKTNTAFCQSSPLVINGTVYARGALVIAYNADTGRLLWRTGEHFPQNYTSVIPWTSGGKQYLISMGSGGNQYYQGRAYCLAPDSGRVIWETANYVSSMAATPVIAGDLLVSDRAVMKLTPQGGRQFWPLKTGAGNHSGSPIVYQGHVYVHASRPEGVVCDDVNTGEVKWKCGNKVDDPSGVAVLVDGKLIGNCADGTVMYRATPEKYEELGRFRSNATICTSPAIVGGRMFRRLKDVVACYDLTQYGP
jgi:outer membrane protein assembly factor BamB